MLIVIKDFKNETLKKICHYTHAIQTLVTVTIRDRHMIFLFWIWQVWAIIFCLLSMSYSERGCFVLGRESIRNWGAWWTVLVTKQRQILVLTRRCSTTLWGCPVRNTWICMSSPGKLDLCYFQMFSYCWFFFWLCAFSRVCQTTPWCTCESV